MLVCAAISTFITALTKFFKKIAYGVLGYFGITTGVDILSVIMPNASLYEKTVVIFLFILLVKILFVVFVIYYRDAIILFVNSFIGASLFVLNFGYLIGSIDNIYDVINRYNYDDNYELVN